MRVIFTGQPGIGKLAILEKFIDYLESKEKSSKYSLYSAEKAIAPNPAHFSQWLKDVYESSQKEIWSKRFGDTLSAIEKKNPKNVFLSMHSVFYRNKRFFCPLDWKLLARFKPDLFVTFIDDIYDIWWRLDQYKKILAQDEQFKLRDLMVWRSVEIMMTDTLAGNLLPNPVKNFVLAVKHPVLTLEKIIERPDSLRVYSSFPITGVRPLFDDDSDTKKKKMELVRKTDENRKALHENFLTFDPLSIDEFILKARADEEEKAIDPPKTLSINRKRDRWDIPSQYCDLPTLSMANVYPEQIDGLIIDEIKEIKNDIHRQIETRDFRLIDQSQTLAAYRPNFLPDGGHRSTGVADEIRYNNSSHKNSYLFWPEEDGGETPFSPHGTKADKMEDHILNIKKEQKLIEEANGDPTFKVES